MVEGGGPQYKIFSSESNMESKKKSYKEIKEDGWGMVLLP